MIGRKGAVLLNVIVFMIIGLFILTGYFLRSYYQAQRAQNEIERTILRYTLEGDLQRAIALVKSSGRKDLTDSTSFPNQAMWLTPGLTVEVKEFTNWDGYVVTGSELLNEANAADPIISDDYPVSIRVISSVFGMELEYIIPAPTGGEAFTLYAHDDLILDGTPNWYPYYSTDYAYYINDYWTTTNDVRVENAIVKYNNGLTGETAYKFGTGSDPVQGTLDLPFYLAGSQSDFNTWLQSLVTNGTVMPEGDYYSDLYVSNLRNYHWRFRPWNRPTQFNVIAVFGDLTINANYSYTNNPINNDMLFIVTGDVYMTGEYWFEGNGRLGVVAYGDILVYSQEMIGGSMYLIGNSISMYTRNGGNISMQGKLFSGGDLTLYADDYYEDTGTDFTAPKDLRGLNVQDKVNIFEDPRAVTVDLDLPSGSGGVTGNAIWR